MLGSLCTRTFPRSPLSCARTFFTLMGPRAVTYINRISNHVIYTLCLLPTLTMDESGQTPIHCLCTKKAFPSYHHRKRCDTLLHFTTSRITTVKRDTVCLQPTGIDLLSCCESRKCIGRMTLQLSDKNEGSNCRLQPQRPFLALFRRDKAPGSSSRVKYILLPVAGRKLSCYCAA